MNSLSAQIYKAFTDGLFTGSSIISLSVQGPIRLDATNTNKYSFYLRATVSSPFFSVLFKFSYILSSNCSAKNF